MDLYQSVQEKITAVTIAEALNGFSLISERSLDDMTKVLRAALRISIVSGRDVSWSTSRDFNRRGPRGGPDRQGNANTKKNLASLAKQADDLFARLRDRSRGEDDALWFHALWNNPLEDRSQPSDHSRFLDAISELEWLSDFLRTAAAGIEKQAPRWVDAERREQRIFHAHCLSSVFEWAYGRPPTIISRYDELSGPWPDFFQRIMQLAFDESRTPNLENVLDEARRRYKNGGVLFSPENFLNSTP